MPIDTKVRRSYNQRNMGLFGSSGVRRIFDIDLLNLALKIGLVVGRDYPGVVIGRDTRTSSDALKHTFVAGLLAAGGRSYDAGIVTTPTLALAAWEFDAGAMITASHNPPEYNGIKLWNADGSAFDSVQREQIEDLVLKSSNGTAPWRKIGSSEICDGAVEQHSRHILEDISGKFSLKVALDCCCGAASVITPYILKRLGCDVIAINCNPSGFFPHPIEPTDENLGDLKRVTLESGADLGIAHDGDGDRMMAVDGKGRFIPGDKLLVVFARHLAAKEVVTTVDASMVIDEIGFKVTRTPVGDAFISEEIKRGGDFGGEASGSWIFPRSLLCPDGVYAAAQLVAIASQQELANIVDEIPDYPLIRGSIDNRGIELSNFKERLLAMEPVSIDDTDGVRLNFKDGWLLVRISGTEPKIRLTTEARSEARVNQLYESTIRLIREYTEEQGTKR